MTKKFQIYIDGGTMKGLFSGGVVTALQDADTYPLISHGFGNSAGLMSWAYFLSRQTRLGSSIYYENLVENFINPENISLLEAFVERASFFAFGGRKPRSVVDIDYLFDVVKNEKVLDVEKVRSSPIPVQSWVYDLSTKSPKKIDLRTDPLHVLHSAVSVVPWYVPEERESG